MHEAETALRALAAAQRAELDAIAQLGDGLDVVAAEAAYAAATPKLRAAWSGVYALVSRYLADLPPSPPALVSPACLPADVTAEGGAGTSF